MLANENAHDATHRSRTRAVEADHRRSASNRPLSRASRRVNLISALAALVFCWRRGGRRLRRPARDVTRRRLRHRSRPHDGADPTEPTGEPSPRTIDGIGILTATFNSWSLLRSRRQQYHSDLARASVADRRARGLPRRREPTSSAPQTPSSASPTSMRTDRPSSPSQKEESGADPQLGPASRAHQRRHPRFSAAQVGQPPRTLSRRRARARERGVKGVTRSRR